MTGTELIVILGGLVLGYWLVSVFMPHATKPGAEAQHDQPDQTYRNPRDEGIAGQHDEAHESPSSHWYQILGVDESASREQIVAAYKIKIGQYHPDKVSQMGDEIRRLADVKSKQINAAYEQAMRMSS